MSEHRTLAESLFRHIRDQELGSLVRSERSRGRSWRQIRDDVRSLTGGEVDLTHQTLLNWYGNTDADEA